MCFRALAGRGHGLPSHPALHGERGKHGPQAITMGPGILLLCRSVKRYRSSTHADGVLLHSTTFDEHVGSDYSLRLVWRQIVGACALAYVGPEHAHAGRNNNMEVAWCSILAQSGAHGKALTLQQQTTS